MASPRERILLSLVVISLLGAVGFLGGFQAVDWWNGLDEEIINLQKEITERQKMQSEKMWLEGRYDRIKTDLVLEGTPSEQQAALDKEVRKLLDQAKVKYGEMQPLSPREEADFKVLLVDISEMEGSPESIFHFIHLIEDEASVLFIETLDISNSAGTGRVGRDKELTASARIARLVQYATGEAPESKRRGRSRARGN